MSSSATVLREPPSPQRPGTTGWHPSEFVPVVALLVFGGVLLAAGHGLWFDELFTAEVGRLPLGDIVAAIAQGRGTTSYLADVPPSYNAPYYVVVHAWMSLPGLGGDTSLRVFSLLSAAGGLALITRAVCRLAGRATGVAAGTVLALSPLVLEQAVEARSYGLVVAATGGAVLGLARWLQEPPRGLLLFGLAGAGMGLAHWYAATALAAFVVAALLLRGRAALPVLLTGAVAVLPTVALIGVNLANGTGSRNAAHLRTTDGRLAGYALEAWAVGSTVLVAVTVVLMVVGAVAARQVRVVAGSWVLVPLVLLTLGELVRPLYLPRYLLAGLLGVGVLAAAGAMALPRPARPPALAALLAATLLASWPVLDRGPRERADDMVALLAGLHTPGEPVVAADQRSALGLDHYTRLHQPQLRADMLLPPDDAPPDADRVWLIRRIIDGAPEPTDDDAILRAAGLRQADEWSLPGSKTTLVLQLWTR